MNGPKQERTNEKQIDVELGDSILHVLANLRKMIDDGRGDERISMSAKHGDEPAPSEMEGFEGPVRDVYAKFMAMAKADPNQSPEFADAIQRLEDLDNPNTMKEAAEKLLANATPEQIASDAPLDWKWRASKENALKQFRELIDKGMGDKVFQHTTDGGETHNITANEIYRQLVEEAHANGMTEQEYGKKLADAAEALEAQTGPAPYDRHLDEMTKAVYAGRPDDARRALKKADLIRERDELYGKLDGVNEELAAIRPEAKATVAKILAHNQQAIERMADAEFTPQAEAELNAIATRAGKLREAMVNTHRMGSPGVYADEIRELDRQVDQILSMQHEAVPAESSGAGKVRVLDEKRVARDRHSQIRELPLRDKIAQLAGGVKAETRAAKGRRALEDGTMNDAELNAASRDMIQSITGRPLIKVIEEIMDESFPDLMKAFYPRIYENVGRYCSPRSCAAMIANVIAEMLRYGAHRTPTAYKMLAPGLSYLRERRMPMFFIAPDLLEAVQRTDFDDDIDWTELELPYETGVFVLPKGALIHPKDGEVSMLIWSRQPKGDHPSPWLGLPKLTTANHCFAILGACMEKMIWYDSIFTANVRPTVRLNNLFYREAGQPIPAAGKATSLDADLTEEDSEFIEKMGVIVFGTIMVMNDRPKLIERGQLIKRVGAGTDKVREFWSPNIIGAKYKFKREIPKVIGGKFTYTQREHGTHASPRLHWRRGHHRNQPVGPGRKERKRIWIEPCVIGAD